MSRRCGAVAARRCSVDLHARVRLRHEAGDEAHGRGLAHPTARAEDELPRLHVEVDADDSGAAPKRLPTSFSFSIAGTRIPAGSLAGHRAPRRSLPRRGALKYASYG